MTDQFSFPDKYKKYSLITIITGIVLLILGYFIHRDNPSRIWGNLLVCSYYFVALGMGSLFFFAVSYTTKSGWSAILMRIPAAVANTLKFSGILLVIVIGIGIAGKNLYQTWANPALVQKTSAHFDRLVLHKSILLNVPTFIGLIIFMIAIWILFNQKLRQLSTQQDEEGTSRPLYKRIFIYSTGFVGFFAISQSVFSFMVMMSNESHEASTMFGWYNFGGIFVTSLSAITLLLIILKENGYYQEVNENHLQNLGTLMFAFTIFFTYTWFFQFMLTWYSNIPDEAFYITQRWRGDWGYKFIYWLNIIICFVIPFFGLLTSDAKRNFKAMKILAIVILVGHWLDWFLQVMPGTVEGKWGIDLPELGAFLLFAGIFSYSAFWSLTRLPLKPNAHAFLEESIHHHIENV